jgi:drug/metabolite transporter (DMT)-like permease
MAARSIAVFLLVGALWGSEWLVVRDLDLPALRSLALRYAMAAAVLGAIVLVRRIPLPRLRLVFFSVVTGVSFAALPTLLTAWARERVSPGLLVVILAMTPLIAALMEGRASGAMLAPLIGGVGGTAVLSSQGLSFAATQWVGAASLLAAAVLIAGSVIYVKRQLEEVPVVVLAAIQLASGAVFLAFASLIVEGRPAFVWSWNLVGIEAALAIAGALALSLYYWLLRRIESFQLTALQWVVTVVGVVEGLLLVREAPTWRMLAGTAILLASLGALLSANSDEASVTLQSILPPSFK